jgi:hypothetical protein
MLSLILFSSSFGLCAINQKPSTKPSNSQNLAEIMESHRGPQKHMKKAPSQEAAKLARPDGIEPSTAGLEDRCSIH